MTPVSLPATSLLRPLPDQWVLRPRRPEDIPGVIELMKRVYIQPHGPEAVWPLETLLRHYQEEWIAPRLQAQSSRAMASGSTTILGSPNSIRAVMGPAFRSRYRWGSR